MRRKDGRKQQIMLQLRECDAEETLVPLFLLGGESYPPLDASKQAAGKQ